MPKATILLGDTRQRLADIPAGTIQTCVTSPPYWGLRDYGHEGQIGLEQKPDEYVAEMVAVFREVRRVLKDDGTLWLNLGDSYAASRGGTTPPAESLAGGLNGWTVDGSRTNRGRMNGYNPSRDAGRIGLKHKDLVGIPWRVAFALQADGWWLRQDIIWHKPNPMPESVTDRCTKAHEYLFLLTKSAKYHFDHKAIAELSTSFNPKPSERQGPKNIIGNMSERGVTRTTEGLNLKSQSEKTKEFRNRRSVWTVATKPFRGAHFAVMPEALVEPCILAGSQPGDTILDPFTGSGTVACVALRHDRQFIGTELNPEYVDIARRRITDDNPMFNEVETQ